jgi:hypothetical protein
LIGERHREEIDASSSAEVGAIVDPFPAATEVAAKFYVPLYSTLAELFEIDNPDGVIQAHAEPDARRRQSGVRGRRRPAYRGEADRQFGGGGDATRPWPRCPPFERLRVAVEVTA